MDLSGKELVWKSKGAGLNRSQGMSSFKKFYHIIIDLSGLGGREILGKCLVFW